MDVSVIVTCWNGRKLLEKNLPFVVLASKNLKNKIKEIIVIDDASEDSSIEFLKENYPNVKVLQHKNNLGYSSVCNDGIKSSVGDLVVILNADVIPSEDFLETVIPLFENEKIFAVSFNEGKFGPGKLVWKNGFLEIESNNAIPKTTTATDWASGGSSIFRKKMWLDLGGMDEKFLPFYFEDIDLSIRARRAGYKCLWEASARVDHKHEATINSEYFSQEYIDSIKQRNHLLLTWKNLNNTNLFFHHIYGLGKRTISHPGYLKIILLASGRFISFNLRKRKNEKN